MGSATAYSLAKRDHDVTLYEQFEIGHRRGSSHGSSRIFRFSYPDARYVAMAMEALPLWRLLEREIDEPLLTTTGGLDMGKDLAEHVGALKACGARNELMAGAAAGVRWPNLTLPPREEVLYQADAGIVLADRAVAAFATGFKRRGGAIRERSPVETLDVDSARVTVGTDEEPYDAAVVTAGAWASSLLSRVGIELNTRPTRETVVYFDYSGPPPPTLVEWGDPSIYSLSAPGYGLKAGEHIAGPETDPDKEGTVNDASVERLQNWVADRFPLAGREVLHAETCLYTNTPDEHFVLRRYGKVVVGSPCSGHGFKFGPLIGEQLADLAEQGIAS